MPESSTEFIVSASAEEYAVAERATVRVDISASSSESKAEAYDAVQSAHTRLAAQARAFCHGDAAAATGHRITAPASYSRKTPYSEADGQSVTEHSTASRVEVEFQDFEEVADWLAALADEALASRTTVVWSLTGETLRRLEAKVRTQAVRNARQLAEDFAAGDGIDVSTLRLAKVDSTPRSPSGMVAGAASAGARDSFSFTPPEVSVSASVTAVFTTSEV